MNKWKSITTRNGIMIPRGNKLWKAIVCHLNSDPWDAKLCNFICHVFIIPGDQWMQNILDWVICMVVYFNPNSPNGVILETRALT